MLLAPVAKLKVKKPETARPEEEARPLP
jgi:hypothetical protein